MTAEFEKTALLALPGIKQGSEPEKGLLSWSRPYLIDQIRQEGVDVLVSRGVTSINETSAEATNVVRPEYSKDTVHLLPMGRIGLGEVDVIRNIVRPVRTPTATPFLNENSIRDLARDKFKIAQTVLAPAEVYHRSSVVISPDQDGVSIRARLDQLTGDLVVAKPSGGQRSRGIFVGNKHDAANFLAGVEESYVVEEKLDFRHAFPDLRAMNSTEQDRLDEANRAGVNKELRMYYFGNGEWDAVGRVARPGETDFTSDKWLHLDLDTVPTNVIRGGERVVDGLRTVSGNDEFNIALDWVYAGSVSRPEPSWQVMEVNAAEPQLVQLGENAEVGRRQHAKLARQISRIALS